MNIPSKLIEDAVNAFSSLPGIGKKTALRLVLHLLKQDKEDVSRFSSTIAYMRDNIRFCKRCHNIADSELCSICENRARDQQMICVVENIRDVIAIENTDQYNGTYHVLGGVISPIDGVGPNELTIDTLISRVAKADTEEVIMALSPTIEGDTTIFYLSKKLSEFNIKVSTIARGISFGDELEYADEVTLARSIATRLPYDNHLVKE